MKILYPFWPKLKYWPTFPFFFFMYSPRVVPKHLPLTLILFQFIEFTHQPLRTKKKVSDLEFKTQAVSNTELHLNTTSLLIRYFHCLVRSVKGGESVVCQYLLLSWAGWRVQLNLLQGRKTSISDILNSLKIGIYRNSMIVIAGTFLALLGNIFLSKAISSMSLKIMKEIQGI